MPRQRTPARAPASRAPTRPTAAAAPAAPQQQRPATTMAAPPHAAAPPAPVAPVAAAAPVSQGPGLFANMASTAAGVAVGSSIGHAIGGLFSGGGSSEAAPAAPQQIQSAAVPLQDNAWAQSSATNNCQGAATSFTQCMDENAGNMQICNWYLEQLKACQAAAKNY